MHIKIKPKRFFPKKDRFLTLRRPVKNEDRMKSSSLLSVKWLLLGVMMVSVIVYGRWQFIEYLQENKKFELQDVELLHARRYEIGDILQITGLKLKQNIFSYDLAHIKSKLERNIYIRQAHVTRILPGKIEIKIEEREPLAVIQFMGTWYWIDQDGMILDPVRELDESLNGRRIEIQGLHEKIETGIKLDHQKVYHVLEAIRIFQGSLLKKKLNLEVFIVDQNEDIRMINSAGLVIILGKDDIEHRLVRLLTILEDLEIKGQKAKNIDLRFLSVPVKTVTI